MTPSTIRILEQMNPLRLAGPLFDKELRVWSRRRRLYALRFAYIGLFGVVVVWTWRVVAQAGANVSPLVQTSRMGQVGKIITAVVVWFQFITAQLLAAVLLSGAIATEIRHRTLDVLFTTPISSVQIVVGKLASGLLQMGLLLAISLPLLAIVRIFGGVPWDFLLSGLCITLATAVFVAALSLFVGITDRQAQQVAMNAVALCALFWFCSGMVLTLLVHTRQLSSALATRILNLTSPYLVLGAQTRAMFTSSGSGPTVPWFTYCLLALAAAGGLLLLSVWRLRRAVARASIRSSRDSQRESADKASRWRWFGRRAIRPVKGSPIVWKERCRPRLPRNRRGIVTVILMAIAVVLMVACLVLLMVVDSNALPGVCFVLAYAVALLFALDVTSSAAGAIPREKEARTWPILLTTPLEDREIIRGKAIGALRRNLPVLALLPLLGLVALLFSSKRSHFSGGPALYMVGVSAVYYVGGLIFLIGLGLFMGTQVKTATIAVVVTIGLYVGTQAVLGPMFIFAIALLMRLLGGTGAGSSLALSFFGTVVCAALYALVGLVLARVAAAQLRRNVFS